MEQARACTPDRSIPESASSCTTTPVFAGRGRGGRGKGPSHLLLAAAAFSVSWRPRGICSSFRLVHEYQWGPEALTLSNSTCRILTAVLSLGSRVPSFSPVTVIKYRVGHGRRHEIFVCLVYDRGRCTGCRLFARERWPTRIEPSVVREPFIHESMPRGWDVVFGEEKISFLVNRIDHAC